MRMRGMPGLAGRRRAGAIAAVGLLSLSVLPAVAAEASKGAAIAADLPASQKVGEEILARGGSAADAAVAALLALAVENPASSGLGGGGFAVVWEAGKEKAAALDFRERAPAGASAEHYAGEGGRVDPEKSLAGCYAVGVPGFVAGMAALHARLGRLPWKELVEPARRMADGGVAVGPFLAHAARTERERLVASKTMGAYVRSTGVPLREGEKLVDLELAKTLETIAELGGKGFYEGRVAEAIEAACAGSAGAVRKPDLQSYEPVWREPVAATFKGFDVWSAPPPSAGGTMLAQILNVLEPMSFDRRGARAARSHHLLAEAFKHAFADRATLFGDPAFVDVPVAELASKAWAAKVRERIDPKRTLSPKDYGRGVGEAPKDGGTTHVSVVDAQGNAVAVTSSVNGFFGSFVRAAGVVLNNTMDDFSFGEEGNLFGLVGSKKNALEPGKRPVSSMTPTVVTRKGRVRLVVGGSGGGRIVSGTTQAVLGVLVEGRTAQAAVDLPRLHHQWVPDRLFHEDGVPSGELLALAAKGHLLEKTQPLSAVQVVEVVGGRAAAASDSRKAGTWKAGR